MTETGRSPFLPVPPFLFVVHHTNSIAPAQQTSSDDRHGRVPVDKGSAYSRAGWWTGYDPENVHLNNPMLPFLQADSHTKWSSLQLGSNNTSFYFFSGADKMGFKQVPVALEARGFLAVTLTVAQTL